MTGKVIRVLPDKGFGFIRDENGESRFMHVRECESLKFFESLKEGSTVEFTPMNDGKGGNGLWAKDVHSCSS